MDSALEQTEHPDGILHAENIGGIGETTVEFSPGVTILVGRNATNRTSFLQAVMAALGSDNVAIKGDADEAVVELTIGDEAYTRNLSRSADGIAATGDPYLDDPELADLFAFLLESNEARRAVATSGDLRELIMRPVDIDEIHAEIDHLVRERESLDEELDDIDSLKGELPDLEAQRSTLQDQIEEATAALEEKEAELEAADADVEETRDEKSELDSKLEELRTKRSALEDLRYDIETETESLDALRTELRDVEAELDELPDTPVGERSELDATVRQLRDQKQSLESEVSELQSVISFNEEMLEDASAETFAALTDDDVDDLTDQLLEGDDVTCWTCGSEVERDQIEATVDRLMELRKETVSEISDLEAEIERHREARRELERAQRERDQLEQQVRRLESDIEQSEETLEDQTARRNDLIDEIESLEAAVEALQDEDFSAVIDLHKEANQLEYELGKHENDLERVETRIAEVEARIADESKIEEQREEINEEIQRLRTRIERIEEEAIDHFNVHMETVLDILEYSNLDRIWLERVETETREGRRKVTKSVFEQHVIRTTASGAAYEDTVDHLSESEREVTGLVFALAGYLAHQVYEDVPFILMDSLEAIDSERIATLIDYLDDYAAYMLVALLPEDASALPDDYERVTEI